MDEKTEELRDIFLQVADEEAVTEHQRDDRGSLDTDRDTDAELREVIGEMREFYEFDTALDDDQLVALVSAFYDGVSDEELAETLDTDERSVRRARFDLHLVRDQEREASFDLSAAVKAAASGTTIDELSERFGVDEATLRRHLRIHDVDKRSRQANQRFRDAFDSILADAELASRMVQETHRDGLDDATEGLETNVSF